MRISLAQLFTRNWPLKLAALFLAILLYVAVAAQQPINQTFTLNLQVRVPPGRALRSAPPPVVVVVEGRGGELLKLRSFDKTISVTVPDTLAGGTWHLALRASDIGIPKNADVQVTDITPRDISVMLDSVARKDVRIVARVTVSADSGGVLQGGLAITPNLAHLVGPDQLLATIDSVTTVPTELTGLSGPFVRTVPLDTTNLGVIRMAPRDVQVSGEIAVPAHRVFGGIPVETGAGVPTGFVFSPDRVSVEVAGAAPRLANLTRDSVKVIARVSGTAAAGAAAHLTVLTPPGVAGHAVPDSAALKTAPRHK